MTLMHKVKHGNITSSTALQNTLSDRVYNGGHQVHV